MLPVLRCSQGMAPGFIHPKLTAGLGRDPTSRLRGSWVQERSLKAHGGDAASYCRRRPAVPGGSSVTRPCRLGKTCRGRSLVGWGMRAAIVQPVDGLWHLVMCLGSGTEQDAGEVTCRRCAACFTAVLLGGGSWRMDVRSCFQICVD